MKIRLMLIMLFLTSTLAVGQEAAPDEAQRLALRRTPIVIAVERVRDSVVNISTEQTVSVRRGFGPFGPGDPFDRFFEDFWSGTEVERRKVQIPLGSGCIITPDGLVITNEHVIRRATNIQLSLDTGETYEAELLAADPSGDLALLRAKADKPLKSIPMGISSDLMLGEPVIALGNPFGFENSVTSGIVSALNREITIGEQPDVVTYTGLVQTSAAINPGNSGGPLVNIFGELIGINTAVVDMAQGIGFAIPVDTARETLAPLLAGPRVTVGWLGIEGETIKGRNGARVVKVNPDGPAVKLLQPGDIITETDALPVKDIFDLDLFLVQRKPGDSVTLQVTRAGNPVRLRVTLAQAPTPSAEELLRDKLGVSGQDLTNALARPLNLAINEGVLISNVLPKGPADFVGINRGDVIIRIGALPVRNMQDAAAALQNAVAGQRLLVVIVRQNVRAQTVITVAH